MTNLFIREWLRVFLESTNSSSSSFLPSMFVYKSIECLTFFSKPWIECFSEIVTFIHPVQKMYKIKTTIERKSWTASFFFLFLFLDERKRYPKSIGRITTQLENESVIWRWRRRGGREEYETTKNRWPWESNGVLLIKKERRNAPGKQVRPVVRFQRLARPKKASLCHEAESRRESKKSEEGGWKG